jgi:hypothetical protein
VSLERGSHLAPLGLEHAGEHQDRKSQQGKGRYDILQCGQCSANVPTMSITFVLPMFFQPPVRPEVLEIPPIIL